MQSIRPHQALPRTFHWSRRAVAALTSFGMVIGCANGPSVGFDENADGGASPEPEDRVDGAGADDGAAGADGGTTNGGGGADASCVMATWTAESSGTTNDLAAVWADSTDVYAGGSTATMLHSDGGGSWAARTLPSPNAGVGGIWGVSAEDVYVGWGAAGILHSSADGGWNIEGAFLSGPLGVWGSSKDDVYAPNPNNGSIGHRAADGTWTGEPSNLTGSSAILTAVWGSGSTNVYVCGFGPILRSTGNGVWSQETRPLTGPLRGIWGSGPGDVYAVGDYGVILHSTGNASWTQEVSGTTENLRGVWGSGHGDIYAVGVNGTILHSTGGGDWTARSSGTTQALISVFGTSSCNVYVVGAGGTVLHLH